jgi:hypothetical protein
MSHLSLHTDLVAVRPVATALSRAGVEARWGWIEFFAGVQLLWGALLFIPAIQPYRMLVRAVPYVASLLALVLVAQRSPNDALPSSARWLLASLALLAASLLHPNTYLVAGIAQVVFQMSITAPIFWITRMACGPTRLTRLLWIIFVAGLLSAGLGVLQAYAPDRFLPPEFSGLARQLNPEIVSALSYIGPDGVLIVRPSGLTDIPGGAAVSGLLTVLLGIAFASHERTSRLVRTLCTAAAAIGMTALYLTQVRSLTIMAALGVLMFAAIRFREGRVVRSAWIATVGVALVAASFQWATSLGGTAVQTRFSGLIETGLFTTFQESRGQFLDYTFRDLLFRYPLGAGLGRWGMMQVYFADPSMWHAPPIHVEIQLTGWLLDGGVLMWLFYGGALASAIALAYRSGSAGLPDSLRYPSAIVLVFQISVIGLCLAGPVFNTQLGVVFWMVTGALYSATRGTTAGARALAARR